jgi:hypothetical protein
MSAPPCAAGQTILGPAPIEEDASVTVLEPGHRLRPTPPATC